MTADRRRGTGPARRRPHAAAGVLMALTAAAFAVASTVHFGVDVPIGVATISDPFPGAAPPEAVIAAVLAVGAVAALTRRAGSRATALAAAAFALLGTAYGLSVTLAGTRTGDVVYHLGVLAAALASVGLLLVPGRPDARPPRDAGTDVRAPS